MTTSCRRSLAVQVALGSGWSDDSHDRRGAMDVSDGAGGDVSSPEGTRGPGPVTTSRWRPQDPDPEAASDGIAAGGGAGPNAA